MLAGTSAALVQIVGLLFAMATPYDTQGAVGKAFVALYTQMGAIPLALIGIAFAMVHRFAHGLSDAKTRWGLLTATVGLVPWPLLYVLLVR